MVGCSAVGTATATGGHRGEPAVSRQMGLTQLSGSSSVHDAQPCRSLPTAIRRALLAVVLGGLCFPATGLAYSPPPIRHVFVLVDENESASTAFGTGSPAPYLSQTLVAAGAYLPNYYAIGHNSADNYIAMVSGQPPNPLTEADCVDFVNFPADSMTSAGLENGQGCVYPADVPTLMSQLDGAGFTWRAYEDGMGADPTRESATCGYPGYPGLPTTTGPHDPT
jgi:phosphatidylinositol-3-phosphatase